MTSTDPTSVIHGIAYVIWVKIENDFKSPVVIYGIARKGSSKFGHQDFKYVCEVNGFGFISRKVDEGNAKPSWQDCLDEMKVCGVENGDPRYFNDKPYSFADITAAAYKEGIFTHKDGLAILAKRSKPSKSSVLKSVEAGNSDLLSKAKAASDKLNADKSTDGMTLAPQHQYIIPGLMHDHSSSVEDEVTVVSECLVESTPEDKNNNDDESTKSNVPSPLQLQIENAELKAKLDEVSAKLLASQEAQTKFMVAGDMLHSKNQSYNEDTASTITRVLEPKLSSIPKMDTTVSNLSTTVSELKQTVDKFSDLITSSNASNATNLNSMSEDIKVIKNSLENFGIDEDEEGVNIPDVLLSLNSLAGSISSPEGPKVTQGCYFQSREIPAIYVCTCGCGHEVQVDPKYFQGNHGQNIAGQQVFHGSNSTETVRTDQNVIGEPDSHHHSLGPNVVSQCVTPSFPLAQGPPYPTQNFLPYPPAEVFPSYYAVQDIRCASAQDPSLSVQQDLTKKGKRLLKNKEFYANKKRMASQNSGHHFAPVEMDPSRPHVQQSSSLKSNSRPNISPWLDSSTKTNDGSKTPQKYSGGSIWIN